MGALFVEVEARAERCGQPFVHEVNARGLGVVRSVSHRALFERGGGAGHAYDQVAAPFVSAVNAAYEGGEHLFRHVEIFDRAAAHGAMHLRIARLAPQKLESLCADRENLPGVFMDRDRRGLVEDYAPARRIDQSVDGAEVYRQIICKKVAQYVHFLKLPGTKPPCLQGEAVITLS